MRLFNDRLSKLIIHTNLKHLDRKKVGMVFDAISLNPSAFYHEKSVYPYKESGFALTPQKNDVYVEGFNNQPFNQDGNGNAII